MLQCSLTPPSILYISPQAVAAVLDRPNEPVSDATYFDCMDTIMEKSKLLGEAGALITTHAKKGEYEEFGKAVDSTSEAVCQLTESAAQVCYLFVRLFVCLCLVPVCTRPRVIVNITIIIIQTSQLIMIIII